ncbi:MAG: O-antigen ligase family protein, partial [Desulfurobacteriaceae bacterium]
KGVSRLSKKSDINHHLFAYFISFYSSREESRLKTALNILGASLTISVTAVIFEAFTGQNIKHLNLHTISFHLSPIRAVGLLNNPLTTSGVLYLLLILFITFYIKTFKKHYLFFSITALLGIIFTQSRSYWLATLFFSTSVLLLLLIKSENRKNFLAGTVALTALFTASIASFPILKNRLESITDTKNNYSNLDRLSLWKSHLKAYTNEYSLLQKIVGAGTEEASKLCWHYFKRDFPENFPTGKNPSESNIKVHFHSGEAHNIYLKFLTKYGILGLLGYLLFWAYMIYLNTSAKELWNYSIALGYLGFMIAGIFENNFTDAEIQIALWYITGINLALLRQGNEKTPLHQTEAG